MQALRRAVLKSPVQQYGEPASAILKLSSAAGSSADGNGKTGSGKQSARAHAWAKGSNLSFFSIMRRKD
eukprot:1160852-Pelagomonas_calceolata.AAC.3